MILAVFILFKHNVCLHMCLLKRGTTTIQIKGIFKCYCLKKKLLDSCILRSNVYDCGTLELIRSLILVLESRRYFLIACRIKQLNPLLRSESSFAHSNQTNIFFIAHSLCKLSGDFIRLQIRFQVTNYIYSVISLLSTTNLGKGVGGNGERLSSIPLHYFVQVQDTRKTLFVFVFISSQY